MVLLLVFLAGRFVEIEDDPIFVQTTFIGAYFIHYLIKYE